jgi:DNA-binding XRE family transcriptional regulator
VKSSGEPRKKGKLTNMTQKDENPVETLWMHGRWGRAIKAWRKHVGWSANDLAKALGVSRSYIKHIESDRNGWEVRPRIEKKLRALMKDTPHALPQSKTRTLVSRYHIPRRLFVAVAPRRCRGHGHPVLFGSKNQVYCGRECKRIYLRRLRRERKAEEEENETSQAKRKK